MARKKKVKQNIKLHGIADKGLAVGRDEEGMVYFVDGPVPGDVVDVLITRKKSSFKKGVVHNYISYSEERSTPFCDHFNLCGGCKWQHLNYESQLKYKQQAIEDAFRRIAKSENFTTKNIMGCKQTSLYRNKMEYSFSSRRWVPQEELDTGEKVSFGPASGFHRAGAFDKIVQINKCHLQEDLSNAIRNRVDSIGREKEWTFYNSREHSGFLRNLMIRNTTKGEWMIVMVFGENNSEDIDFLLNTFKTEFPQLTSIYYVINTKLNDVIYDLDLILYHGKPYILEALGHIEYNIGPKSFFQTNTRQAKNLYDVVVEMADLEGDENVYDLYTGLGSIALYIANNCKQVVGIEEVPDAIKDANRNKEYNNIDNAHFEVGDVKDIFDENFIERYGKADLIIVDPPRAGLHANVCAMLNKADVDKLIYVSCNPATQARDVELLSERYTVETIQPVDMFPHTHHVENVAVLKNKGK